MKTLATTLQRIPVILVAVSLIGRAVYAGDINIQMVTVGDPGNAPDTAVMNDGTTGYGSVDYVYSIGKYDVTQSQYAAFLNAKAATDPYGLYSQYAPTDVQNGIVRSGSPGTYTYSVSPAYTSFPAVDVSLYDAMRFANWLTNGQGNGDTETGSYTITNPVYYPAYGFTEWTVTVPSAAERAAWAASSTVHYLVPSEDEFYKAAYYKSGGTNAGYWTVSTQTDSPPISEPPPGGSNSMNIYSDQTGYALSHSTFRDPLGIYLTNVGAYPLALSAYGTLDQGDDVKQWTDTYTMPQLPEITPTGNDYVFRGDSWFYPGSSSSFREWNDADEEDYISGFRVVSVGGVPEPSSACLLVAASVVAILVWSARLSFQKLATAFRELAQLAQKIRSYANAIFHDRGPSVPTRASEYWISRLLRFEALEFRALLGGGTPAMPTITYFNPATGQPYPAGVIPADGFPSPLSFAFAPAQIQGAYGTNQIAVPSGEPGLGYGQTIAIVDDGIDPYAYTDLNAFSSYYGLPTFSNGSGSAPIFQAVIPPNQNPGNPTDNWAEETSLDIEWAHVVAPYANIDLVEASDLYGANAYAATLPGVSVVSNSWGQVETSNEPDFDSYFIHPGVTFLAATGDSGSPGIYPAYSPNVVAVGGTILNVNGNSYVSESGWKGSGGGQSLYENVFYENNKEPTYQYAVQNSGYREIPDVSLLVGPVSIYDSYDYGTPNSWNSVGGTSLATPCWGG